MIQCIRDTTRSLSNDQRTGLSLEFIDVARQYSRGALEDFQKKFKEKSLKRLIQGESEQEIIEKMSALWGDNTEEAIKQVFGDALKLTGIDDDDKERVRVYLDRRMNAEHSEIPFIMHTLGSDLLELGHTVGSAAEYYDSVTPKQLTNIAREIRSWRTQFTLSKIHYNGRTRKSPKIGNAPNRQQFVLNF